MRRIPCLAVLFVLVCVAQAQRLAGGAVPEADEPIPAGLGVNIHFTSPKPGEMEMLAAGGFKWVRMDFLWNQTWSASEKVKGVYDFAQYDTLMAAADGQGLRVLAIFAYGNPLYDKGLSPHTDEGRQAYARWAVAAAKHFAGRGIIWENWNEPNGRLFWKPTPKAEDYAKLAVEVGKAFRESVPDETLVGPALSKFDWPFLETCFQAGVLEYWSAVTVHPYRNADPETVAEDYRKLRRLIAQYAPPGKQIPIISGEWGYFLTLGSKSTPELQGKLLARQWLTNLACAIPLSIWYDWKNDGTNPQNIEHNFGTVGFAYREGQSPVYEPKPAYVAAQTLTRELRGFRFSKRIATQSPRDHVLLFVKDGQSKLAAWTQGEAHDVVVPASAGAFGAVSHAGEALADVVADASGLKIHLTDGPQYLAPREANDLLALMGGWETLPDEMLIYDTGATELRTTLRNVTSKTIRATVNGGQAFSLAAGEAAALAISCPANDGAAKPVRVVLNIEGIGEIAQQTTLRMINYLQPVLMPVGDRACLVSIENLHRRRFAGRVSVAVRGERGDAISATAAVEVTEGDRVKQVKVEMPQVLPDVGSASITLTDTEGKLISVVTTGYSAEPADALGTGGYGTWPTKDQSLKAEAAPEPPATQRGPVMRLDYSFTGESNGESRPAAEKALTLSITPKPKRDKITAIRGKPVALQMWIYGDGSNNPLCARFSDSTGQVFQPSSEPIHWKGWRLVRFALDDPWVWHWGGAKEDVIYYPIQWHTLLLMDAAGKKRGSGTIWFCSPTVVWDGPIE